MNQLTPISLTVDLEWWGRAHLLHGKIPFHQGIEKDMHSLDILLEHFTAMNIPATFFIVANDIKQEMVKRIASLGHEIASHCVDHSYYKGLPDEKWRSNLFDSKKYLEDASGQKVSGFRTPSWSVEYDRASFHLGLLKEVGYEYDSSFCSLETKIYGDKRFKRKPYITEQGIVEFPLPVIGIPEAPWMGGTYLRLAPRWYARHFIKKEKPCFMYIHPWELYKNEEQLPKLSAFDHFVTTYGRKEFLKKVLNLTEDLKKDFTFITLREQADTIRNSSPV